MGGRSESVADNGFADFIRIQAQDGLVEHGLQYAGLPGGADDGHRHIEAGSRRDGEIGIEEQHPGGLQVQDVDDGKVRLSLVYGFKAGGNSEFGLDVPVGQFIGDIGIGPR